MVRVGVGVCRCVLSTERAGQVLSISRVVGHRGGQQCLPLAAWSLDLDETVPVWSVVCQGAQHAWVPAKYNYWAAARVIDVARSDMARSGKREDKLAKVLVRGEVPLRLRDLVQGVGPLDDGPDLPIRQQWQHLRREAGDHGDLLA